MTDFSCPEEEARAERDYFEAPRDGGLREQTAAAIDRWFDAEAELRDVPDRYAEWFDTDALAAAVLEALGLSEERRIVPALCADLADPGVVQVRWVTRWARVGKR